MQNKPGDITWISTTEKAPWRKMKCAASSGNDALLEVTETGHQTWWGFGGCFNELGSIALSKTSPANRKKVLDELFDSRTGCGFTLCRLPIGASDYGAEWYSHNETDGDYAMKHFSIARDRKYLLPYIKEAIKRQPGIKFFASPWSPPTWMKFPKAFNYGKMIWTKKNLEAYALYFSKFVQAYRKEGVNLRQIHVQNEPLADQKFPSCVWTGSELREFIRDYMGPRFKKDGLDCEIWLGTLNTSDYNNYVHGPLSDPRARQYIAGVGFQWDGKGAVQRMHDAWPEVPMMQTENECGDGRNSWDHAQYAFSLMQHYINNGVVAYVYWNMVLEPTGRSTWGWQQNSMITIDGKSGKVTLAPEFWMMKHFARFVKPGAVRLGLAGRWQPFGLAFANSDGSRVLVVNNPFNSVETISVAHPEGAFSAKLSPRSFNTFVM
jgi:glucosylceramidase